jgi:hypothetical protein
MIHASILQCKYVVLFKNKYFTECINEISIKLLTDYIKQFNYLRCKLNIDGEPDSEKKIDFKGYVAL